MSKLQREETRLKALINIARPALVSSVETKIFSTSTVGNKKKKDDVFISDSQPAAKSETGSDETTAIIETITSLEDAMPAPPVPTTARIEKSSALSANVLSRPGTSKVPKQPKLDVVKPTEEASVGQPDHSEGASESQKIGLVIRKRKKKGAERHESEVIVGYILLILGKFQNCYLL